MERSFTLRLPSLFMEAMRKGSRLNHFLCLTSLF